MLVCMAQHKLQHMSLDIGIYHDAQNGYIKLKTSNVSLQSQQITFLSSYFFKGSHWLDWFVFYYFIIDFFPLIISLGAYHDGDGNNCSKVSQYIMASDPQLLSDSIFNNPFAFSNCSIKAFRNWFNQLNE